MTSTRKTATITIGKRTFTVITTEDIGYGSQRYTVESSTGDRFVYLWDGEQFYKESGGRKNFNRYAGRVNMRK